MIDKEKVLTGLECCSMNGNGCRQCPYNKECDEMPDFGNAQLCSDALELLKQEPVKPVVNQDEWVCGCCGTWLERQRMIHPGAILHDLCEYCPSCGKKVDWEAVKQDG